MDLATMVRVHELSAVYGGAGLDQDENNLHCPLCTEKNDLCRWCMLFKMNGRGSTYFVRPDPIKRKSLRLSSFHFMAHNFHFMRQPT
jgi:hypothetical protein